MAIEIFDCAEIVKKDGEYFYFLMFGSKNCFSMPGQYVDGPRFNRRYTANGRRESNWHLVAVGGEKEFQENAIAKTFWNSFPGHVYGKIRFGNRKNIALYFTNLKYKNKVLNYEDLNYLQQNTINFLIHTQRGTKFCIDLSNIPEHQGVEEEISYCEPEPYKLKDHFKVVHGIKFWDLNVL